MFYFWVISKYMKTWRQFFDVTIWLTLAGISIGVAVMVVAMASFSGFQATLQQALIEVVGDVSIYRQGGKIDNIPALEKELVAFEKDTVGTLRFLTQESLFASQGKISAVLVQGVDKEKAAAVLNMQGRKVEGTIDWTVREDVPAAFVGKDLLKKMNLKIGDTFRIVMPKPSKTNTSELTPLVQSFYVAASLDLGKYDFNTRFVFVDLAVLQERLNTEQISGLRIKLKNSELAEKWAESVQEKIGWKYAAVDWKQTNRNYFKAIEYEKSIMFFVVYIIVLASGVNVATTLFVLVLKRYRDISLMKTLGARPFDIVMIFCLQGLVLGCLGVVVGISLGVILCYFFEGLQMVFPLMPADIYKLSFIATDILWQDLLKISLATLVLCFFSTVLPAIRGSRLSPIEGLKYE